MTAETKRWRQSGKTRVVEWARVVKRAALCLCFDLLSIHSRAIKRTTRRNVGVFLHKTANLLLILNKNLNIPSSCDIIKYILPDEIPGSSMHGMQLYNVCCRHIYIYNNYIYIYLNNRDLLKKTEKWRRLLVNSLTWQQQASLPILDSGFWALTGKGARVWE